MTNTQGKKRENRINTTWFARVDIIRGLSFESKINYTHATTESNTYPNQRAKYNFADNTMVTVPSGPEEEKSTYSHGENYRITSDNVLRYSVTIAEDHDISAFEGHMMGEYAMRTLYRGNGSYFNSDNSVNIHGGPRKGMIRTEDDMKWVNAMMAAGHKFNGYSSTSQTGLWYGDFIYSDTNGNKNYGDATDREFLNASSLPKWNVGFSLNAEWKGFDLSMIWQGAFKGKAYNMRAGENTSNLLAAIQLPDMIANDHYFYDPSNPDDPRTNLNAKYPRLKLRTGSDNNHLPSDFYIESVSYLRLKNLQLGYTLPQKIVSKMGISNLRVYFSGENLLTISPYKGIDPETQTYMSYPTLKQFAFGINVAF